MGSRVKVLQVEVAGLPDDIFDAICASYVLEHIAPPGPLASGLREWYRVLRPRGTLYVGVCLRGFSTVAVPQLLTPFCGPLEDSGDTRASSPRARHSAVHGRTGERPGSEHATADGAQSHAGASSWRDEC
jgi:SAM-dependent methyltransferase